MFWEKYNDFKKNVKFRKAKFKFWNLKIETSVQKFSKNYEFEEFVKIYQILRFVKNPNFKWLIKNELKRY